MSVKRITSKKPHKLEQDDDGHWYIIPYDLVDEFNEWIRQESDLDPVGNMFWEGSDFNQFRINGPHTLKIYSWADNA